MSNTKQRILEAAIVLFNEEGVANVRLQQIADGAGISVGNLAYHYHSKKAIVEAIDEQLSASIGPIVSGERRFPSLIDFDNQLARYYHLLMNYSFYFVDLLEFKRVYPKLYEKRTQYIDQIVRQIEYWFNFNVDNEVIRPPLRHRHYRIVAHTIWMIITFWMTEPMEHGTPEEKERVFKEVVWSQVLPYLTEAGKLEFEMMIEPLLDSLPDDSGFRND